MGIAIHSGDGQGGLPCCSQIRVFFLYQVKIGGKKFAVVGTCWGAWANFQISSEIALVCGVNWHPSVQMQELVHQKS